MTTTDLAAIVQGAMAPVTKGRQDGHRLVFTHTSGATGVVDYGPHKTLYNRFVRRSRLGVFDRIFMALVAEAGPPERLMIDSTHLKAHRTAASLLKKGLFPAASAAPRVG